MFLEVLHLSDAVEGETQRVQTRRETALIKAAGAKIWAASVERPSFETVLNSVRMT